MKYLIETAEIYETSNDSRDRDFIQYTTGKATGLANVLSIIFNKKTKIDGIEKTDLSTDQQYEIYEYDKRYIGWTVGRIEAEGIVLSRMNANITISTEAELDEVERVFKQGLKNPGTHVSRLDI